MQVELKEMTEDEVVDMMTEALQEWAEEHHDTWVDVQTFEQVGVMTMDKGFTFGIGDSQYFITVQKQ